MKKNNRVVAKEVAIQSWLRPALTAVGANKDYADYRAQIETVDGLLRGSHLESLAMDFAVEGFEEADAKEIARRKSCGLKALRVEALRALLGNPSFRAFSRTVASSDLLADFCGARRLDGIKGVSKSVLERASKFFDADQLRWMQQVLLEMCGHAARAAEVGLDSPIETDVCLVDTTCLEADIHFPTDWVLLRDVASTLLKAVTLIRVAGLRKRMPSEPAELGRQMNRLCMSMTQARNRTDGPRERKRVLRSMSRLLETIGGHALRHRDRLDEKYSDTKYSEAQAGRVIARVDGMLAQLPKVIAQARERIIGGRPVPDAEKILSVHEPELHVLVRNKAGKKVEFGNTEFIAESKQGIILDWELYRERAPAEWLQLHQSIERQRQFDMTDEIVAACADRGFNAREGSSRLAAADIYDATCPRNPAELKRRFEEAEFAELQRRRGSTEARIAILKQRQGRRLRVRGFDHRYLAFAWVVLGHNLWMIARIKLAQDARDRIPNAA